MPYKIVVTKKCSECGEVLQSERRDFCDGCNVPISQEKKAFDKHVHVYVQMKVFDGHRDDLVFHSLSCFIEHGYKINLKGVDNISIQYLSIGMFKTIMALLER